MEVISRSFREVLVREYPALAERPGYMRLMLYLLSGGFRDPDSGRIVVASEHLARMDGKEAQHRARNFSAERFMAGFRDALGLQFTWTPDWSSLYGKAREVESLSIASEVVRAFERELTDMGRPAEAVDAVSGLKWTAQKKAWAAREQEHEIEAAVKRVEASAPETAQVIRYHNSLPPNRFARVVNANLAEAWDMASQIENAEARRQALSNLRQIQLRPKPMLRPVENSPRAFSDRQSLVTVNSGIRRVFTREWVDYDLRAAQLAIICRLWGLEELRALLTNGKPIWAQLIDAIGLQAQDKPALKKAIYALVFGRSKKRLKQQLKSAFGRESVADDFFKNSVINSIWVARQRRVRELVKSKGGRTVLGRTVEIKYNPKYAERSAPARSLLAQEAQAHELLLIHPVYELARSTEQFTIMLYQFDGFTISYRNAKSAKTWHQKIVKAVREAAETLEIPTWLEHTPGAGYQIDLG